MTVKEKIPAGPTEKEILISKAEKLITDTFNDNRGNRMTQSLSYGMLGVILQGLRNGD